jgi:hypothetical protein
MIVVADTETRRCSLPFQRRVFEGGEFPELGSGEPSYNGGGDGQAEELETAAPETLRRGDGER